MLGILLSSTSHDMDIFADIFLFFGSIALLILLAWIGMVVGIVVLAIVLTIVIVKVCKKNKQKKELQEQNNKQTPIDSESVV